MESILKIKGGNRLIGSVQIAGAKNAALPIMIATILSGDKVILSNIPILQDIKNIERLLEEIGFNIFKEQEDSSAGTQRIEIIPPRISGYKVSEEIASSMRASIWSLGPLLGRCGRAEIALPGGCKLGERKIDIHIEALQKMGAQIYIEDGKIIATTEHKLKSIDYRFMQISVGATANIVMASVLANGISRLSNCAIEPEIVDLANFLVSMGAKISGIGTSTLLVEGVDSLGGSNYKIISDRIEAGTFMAGAAITGGDILVDNIQPQNLLKPIDILSQIGSEVEIYKNSVRIKSVGNLTALDLSTNPFPDFPTDLQSPFCALLCKASGRSRVVENIFENRYLHLNELKKMGAKITLISNQEFMIEGSSRLNGSSLYASDLRAAASLVLSALSAEGESIIYNLHHLDRGYANIEMKLQNLGAQIIRQKVPQLIQVLDKAS